MTDIAFNRKDTGRTLVMGILNCTPDSFSDGGKYTDPDKAADHALQMVEEGADIIDIGGESTRPGFTPVDGDEELKRVIPVIRKLGESGVLMSVDTTKTEVAKAALEAGCAVLNDIGGDLKSGEMARVAAANDAYLVIMFNCRNGGGCSGSVTEAAEKELSSNIEYALSQGVGENRIIVDPGIGFGTTRQQDIELTEYVKTMASWEYPVLYAASRKRIVKDLYECGNDPYIRDCCSDALALVAASYGASIVRSHRIRELKAQLGVLDRFAGGL